MTVSRVKIGNLYRTTKNLWGWGPHMRQIYIEKGEIVMLTKLTRPSDDGHSPTGNMVVLCREKLIELSWPTMMKQISRLSFFEDVA